MLSEDPQVKGSRGVQKTSVFCTPMCNKLLFSAQASDVEPERGLQTDSSAAPPLLQRSKKQQKPVPQIYDAKKFGPDPRAHLWHRPADQRWMMTALYLQGKLWGYVAVDNATSIRPIDDSETEGPIVSYGWLAELSLAAGEDPGGSIR